MKILILALCLFAFSCNAKEDRDNQKAKDLIESQKKIMYLDSVSIAQDMELEIAKYRAEKATGKKDTMTREEHLKKAKEDFK